MPRFDRQMLRGKRRIQLPVPSPATGAERSLRRRVEVAGVDRKLVGGTRRRLIPRPLRVQSGEPPANAVLTRRNTQVRTAFVSLMHPTCILRVPIRAQPSGSRVQTTDAVGGASEWDTGRSAGSVTVFTPCVWAVAHLRYDAVPQGVLSGIALGDALATGPVAMASTGPRVVRSQARSPQTDDRSSPRPLRHLGA